jgi:acetylornithine deacetylase
MTQAKADLTGPEAQVLSAVDEAWVVDRLSRLIAIPSVDGTDAEIEVQHVLAGWLRELDCEVDAWQIDLDEAATAADAPGQEVDRSEAWGVVGTAPSAEGGTPALVFSGHTDVVPPGDISLWDGDPFVPRLADGALYGRGACDMKGGVAAILGAVRALVSSGAAARLAGELIVAFVPGEEDGGQGTLAAIRAGATGDLAIITEPSNLDIVVAHAGAITFRLTVPGRAAHASQRREGVSALDTLSVLLRALEADETARNAAETDPLMTALGLPYPTIVGIVHGGEWASTVLDRVVVDGRYGVRLGQSPADAAADLRRAIDAANAADPFLREHPATVEIVGGQFGSGRVPSDHPLPIGLADAAEAVTGRRPALLGEPYGADMRLFINEGGTPCVMYGPGDVKVAHSADENVPLAEVEECARVLATWVVTELGVESSRPCLRR